MSKKKTSVKTEAELAIERQLDMLIQPLLTVEMIAQLLHDQQFVKEVVRETKQARANPSDVHQLSTKYGVNTKDVEIGLDQTMQDLMALLGDDSE
jgi:hypothetical protein